MKLTLKTGLALAGAMLLGMAAPQLPEAAHAQTRTARCTFNVPAEWGSLKAAAQGYGLIFEDSDGTLRAITQMPCGGFEGPPNVSFEIHRR